MRESFFNKLVACFLIVSFLLSLMSVSVVLGAQVTSYEPTNVVVSGGKTTIYVSWRNPDVDTITKISLYDNATDTLIADDFSITGNAVCSKAFTELSVGDIQKCKLVFEFSDHDAINMILEAKTKNWDDVNLTDAPFADWSLTYYDSSYRYIPVMVTADNVEKNSGNYSMHIESNISSANSGNEWLKIIGKGNSGWDTSKKYRITMYKKSKNTTNDMIYFQYDTKWDKRIQLTWGNDYTEWTKVTQELTPTTVLSSGFAVFVVNPGVMQDFWIDDISIYELDTAGNEIGENLMINGDFEDLKEVPEALGSVNAQGANASAILSWTELADADKINVYEKNNDEILSLRAVVNSASLSVTIPGLVNDTEYTYVLKPVNRYNIEGSGTEVSVVPVKSSGSDEPDDSDDTGDAEEKDKYTPTNVIVSGDSGTICVSWRNPDVETITKVSLYDNETNELIADDFSILADAVCSKEFTDVSAGDIQTCKLVFEFSDHRTISLALDGKADSALRESPFADWSINYYSSAYGYVPIKVSADSKEKNSGNYSMHVASNFISSDGNLGIKIVGKGSSALTSGKKYRITMYKKGQKTTNDKIYFRNDAHWDNRLQLTWGNDYTAWTKVTQDVTATTALSSGFAVFFIDPSAIKDFWIDDISIYELDDAGNEIGENLIINGDFESLSAEYRAQDVTDCVITQADSSVNISWCQGAFTDAVNVYNKGSNGDLSLVGIIREESNITVENLVNNVEHTFVLKAVNSVGIESAGVEVTATPKEDLLKISDFKYYVNNEEIDVLTSGSITAKITVKNNDTKGLSTVLILALYDDKLMTVADVVPVIVEANDIHELSATVTVPELLGGDYTLKVFLWDSLENMVTHVPTRILTE